MPKRSKLLHETGLEPRVKWIPLTSKYKLIFYTYWDHLMPIYKYIVMLFRVYLNESQFYKSTFYGIIRQTKYSITVSEAYL